MLNALFEKDSSLNFWALLGDNFYDQTGVLTKTLFARLSMDVKRRFHVVVPGNHDFWVGGTPASGNPADNFGMGQMQYFPQDTIASVLPPQNDVQFLDFSIDPDVDKRWSQVQNPETNFLAYHKLGNVGFLTFSGAAQRVDMLPHFRRACQYFAATKPEVLLVLGHWNAENYGCHFGMATPEVHAELRTMPGCAELGNRMKYLDGHWHCNLPRVEPNATEPAGFLIGGHGMKSHGCALSYGFLYLDSTLGRLQLYFFPVEPMKNFVPILDCLAAKGGLASCTHLAWKWLDKPLTVGALPASQLPAHYQ